MKECSLKLIYYRDKGICWYCGMVAPRGTHDPLLRATRDHIIPVSEGGPTTPENLKIAHAYCNSARMGLYVREKEDIVRLIASRMTEKQIRVAHNDIAANRESVERSLANLKKAEEFKSLRLAGLLSRRI